MPVLQEQQVLPYTQRSPSRYHQGLGESQSNREAQEHWESQGDQEATYQYLELTRRLGGQLLNESPSLKTLYTRHWSVTPLAGTRIWEIWNRLNSGVEVADGGGMKLRKPYWPSRERVRQVMSEYNWLDLVGEAHGAGQQEFWVKLRKELERRFDRRTDRHERINGHCDV